jgi:hypothetical protein
MAGPGPVPNVASPDPGVAEGLDSRDGLLAGVDGLAVGDEEDGDAVGSQAISAPTIVMAPSARARMPEP